MGSIYNHGDAAEAEQILSACLRGEPWPAAALRRLIDAESPALFSVLAEGLSDRFEPRLVDVYTRIFAEVIAAVRPEHNAEDLVERYQRMRRPRRFAGRPPRTVYVLSRVTLGADVAITSVLLGAARRRFPEARLCFVGGTKSYQLFAADARIEHVSVDYGRNGGLKPRIGVWPGAWDADAIVVDPDSRITQLGLLPVCPEDNYYLFESRAYGADSGEPLGCLARRWAAETFGIDGAKAYIAPAERPSLAGDIAVSFGVGENPGKRVADPFEERVTAALAGMGRVVLDAGAGGEEAARAGRAASHTGVRVFQGSFAGFASIISRARLYVGYDSAGQHAAAACGVPVVSVFAGYPCERFCERWRPAGTAPVEVVRAAGEPETLLAQTLAAVGRLCRTA